MKERFLQNTPVGSIVIDDKNALTLQLIEVKDKMLRSGRIRLAKDAVK